MVFEWGGRRGGEEEKRRGEEERTERRKERGGLERVAKLRYQCSEESRSSAACLDGRARALDASDSHPLVAGSPFGA